MLKKSFIIVTIFLFFSITIIPSKANVLYEDVFRTMKNGITIYVDDDNTEGPWDGTKEYPYQSIKDGINNSSSYDTVFVFNGIYNESVNIDIGTKFHDQSLKMIT